MGETEEITNAESILGDVVKMLFKLPYVNSVLISQTYGNLIYRVTVIYGGTNEVGTVFKRKEMPTSEEIVEAFKKLTNK